ncbi:hypothetical protein HS121_02005 [bacterium]|nr:hypothetical protein [bacterium]
MKIETSHNEQDQGKGSSSSSNAGRIFRVDLHRSDASSVIWSEMRSQSLVILGVSWGGDGLGVFKGVLTSVSMS